MNGKTLGILAVLVAAAGAGYYFLQIGGTDASAETNQILDKYVNQKGGKAEFSQSQKSLGGDITINNLTLDGGKDGPIKFEQVVIHKLDQSAEIPKFLHAKFNGLDIDLDKLNNPAVAIALKQMGYDKLTANFEIDYDYVPDTKDFSLKSNLAFKDAAKLELNLNVGKLGDISQSKDFFSIMGALTQATLINASVTLRDDSLLEKMPSEMTAGLLSSMDSGPQDEFSRKLATEIKNFVKNKGSITLSIAPAQPVAFHEIQGLGRSGPEKAMERLNVTISSN